MLSPACWPCAMAKIKGNHLKKPLTCLSLEHLSQKLKQRQHCRAESRTQATIHTCARKHQPSRLLQQPESQASVPLTVRSAEHPSCSHHPAQRVDDHTGCWLRAKLAGASSGETRLTQAFSRMWQILTNTNMPCVVPTGQIPGDNTSQKSPEGAEMMAQPVKAPAVKPETCTPSPRPTRWKEKTNSHRQPSDLHVSVTCTHTDTQTNKFENVINIFYISKYKGKRGLRRILFQAVICTHAQKTLSAAFSFLILSRHKNTQLTSAKRKPS